MNKTINTIKQRRSIRKYKKKRIPKNLIKNIIEAGTYAPSAHNSQPWRFIVIENKQTIKDLTNYIKTWFKKRILLGKLIGIFNKRLKSEINAAKKRIYTEKDFFFYKAPLLILICAKPNKWAHKDCSLAAENMMLAARSLNIGSCWIGFADIVINKNQDLLNKLGVPKKHEIMAHLVFGYPEKFPDAIIPRKEKSYIIKWI